MLLLIPSLSTHLLTPSSSVPTKFLPPLFLTVVHKAGLKLHVRDAAVARAAGGRKEADHRQRREGTGNERSREHRSGKTVINKYIY